MAHLHVYRMMIMSEMEKARLGYTLRFPTRSATCTTITEHDSKQDLYGSLLAHFPTCSPSILREAPVQHTHKRDVSRYLGERVP